MATAQHTRTHTENNEWDAKQQMFGAYAKLLLFFSISKPDNHHTLPNNSLQRTNIKGVSYATIQKVPFVQISTTRELAS